MAPTSQQPSRLDNNAIKELLRYERFREMLEYLYEYKDELAAAHKAQVVFNCAGSNVRPSRTIYD